MAPGGPRLANPDVVLEPWGRQHRDGLLVAADDERISRYLTNQFPYRYTERDADEWIAICEAQDPVLSFANLSRVGWPAAQGRRPETMCGRGRPRSDGGNPRATRTKA